MAATVRESPNYLKARVDSPDDLQAFLEGNEPGQPEYAFNRVLYIALRLKHWEEDEKLGRACVLFREKFDQIFKRLDELIGLANHFISILRSPTGKRGLTARSHKELRRIILANCEELNYEICDFLAQGILQCARTRRERLRMIREMGFTTIERIRAEISPTKIISLVAIVFLILFFGISIIGALLGHTSNGLGLRLFMSLMVSMNYGAAIYFAITPKRLWDFANIHKVGMRPVIGYIVSGLLAVAAAVVISFIFRAVLFLSFEGSLYSFLFSFPWLGMSFVTAVTIAFLVDDFAIYPERAPKGLRYWESLAAGVMLASAAWYVSLALVQAREWINSLALANVELAWRAMDWRNQIWPHHAPQSGPPSWVMLCSIAFTIGIVLGFEIPHWHRNHSRVADSAEPSKSAPTGNFIRNGLRQGMG
ncbi:MAG TPA: hypothetical protein VEJ16_03240 [Alphaproteobacteria bacterium]|nr:hypothetical protein [Alphaproteobacteria bacterium]